MLKVGPVASSNNSITNSPSNIIEASVATHNTELELTLLRSKVAELEAAALATG